MAGKIRIKLGEMEIEYEGDEQFVKNELNVLLDKLSEIHQKHFPGTALSLAKSSAKNQDTHSTIQGTTATIAAKLGVRSGPDLIIAAAAKLTLVEGKGLFNRREILAAMKEATGIYKKTYLDNLIGYLSRVVQQQKLVEVSADNYALDQNLKTELGAKLAN